MADYYQALAADYDWIFDDDALARGLAITHPATARLLERTSHNSAVLDAACGTGVSAAALARRGYRVWAADGSEAMIAVAAARFRSAAGDPVGALHVGGPSGGHRRAV